MDVKSQLECELTSDDPMLLHVWNGVLSDSTGLLADQPEMYTDSSEGRSAFIQDLGRIVALQKKGTKISSSR
eukprot:3706009-Amphidinium_carterae.1